MRSEPRHFVEAEPLYSDEHGRVRVGIRPGYATTAWIVHSPMPVYLGHRSPFPVIVLSPRLARWQGRWSALRRRFRDVAEVARYGARHD